MAMPSEGLAEAVGTVSSVAASAATTQVLSQRIM